MIGINTQAAKFAASAERADRAINDMLGGNLKHQDISTGDMTGTNANGTAKGGLMNPYQVQTFLEWIQDESPFLKLVRRETLAAPVREIDRTGIGHRIMHGRNEGQALTAGQRATAEFGKMEISTKKVMGQINLTYESLEDNIEKGNFRSRLMRMMSGQVSRDLEDWALNGDVLIPASGAGHALYPTGDDLLCLQDGLIKRVYTQKPSGMPSQNLTGGHIINAASASISLAHFFDLEDAVPSKYFRNAGYVWLTSRGVDLSWREYLTARQTPLGDRFVINENQAVALGRPIITSPFLRGDVSAAAGGVLSPGTNSFLLLLQPSNMTMGVWREILIETDKDIEAQVYKIVLSMRVGWTLEEPDAIAMVENIKRRPR